MSTAFLLALPLVTLGAYARAETVWISAADARQLVGPMVLGAKTGIVEDGALGDYLVSTICVSADNLTGGYAEYSVRLPAAGTYYVWARMRCPLPLDASFAFVPDGTEPSTDAAWSLGPDRTQQNDWQWAGRSPATRGEARALGGESPRVSFRAQAGPFRFRVYARQAYDSVFAPGGWTMARPMFTPRLNVLCLTTDADFVPTDEDAQHALKLTPERFDDQQLRQAAVSLPEASPDEQVRLGKKPIPDWLRCPRFYTKDAWRGEMKYRRSGDIAFMVRQIAAAEGNAFRMAAYWGGDAYFPSRVAPHVPGLGSIDYLAEATETGRRLGVAIVMYVNPNCLYEGHPLFEEALVRQADGSGWGGNRYGIRGAHFACINNPAYRRMLRDLLAEAFSRYELSGLYVDGLTPHRCFCTHCRAKYHAMFDAEMPVEKLDGPQWTVLWEMVSRPQPVGDPNDPDALRYTEFLYRSLVEVTALVSETVKQATPSAVTMYHSWPKPGTMPYYDGTLTEIYIQSPWRHSLWKFGELSNYSNVFPIPTLFNIYLHDHGTEAEARTKMLQGLAGGCYPNCWNMLGMKPMFRFMRENAECFDFARTTPTRFLALPRAVRDESAQTMLQQDRTSPARSIRSRFLSPYVGMYSAITRRGLPIVTRGRSDFHLDLDGFRVLCLANEACLADEQIEAIRRFVAAGGGLIATHETSLYDTGGNRRDDFGLADVFGVHFQSMLPPGQRSVRVDVRHPVTAELAPGETLGHDDCHAVVELGTAAALATTNGGNGDGSRIPAVVVNHFGKGRVVYIPGRLDAIQCDVITPAIEWLVAAAVRWAACDQVPVAVSADVPVAVTSFDQAERRVVHLVSLNGDTRYETDRVEAAGRVTVHLAIPPGKTIHRIRRLWTKVDIPVPPATSNPTLTLENVGQYEVLAIEWQ